uniref:USP domain-containing protein n=1 Tax=Rhabditophanes sp. KR3021 TaxID=114890 RepID=A0AC35TKV8_9BILA
MQCILNTHALKPYVFEVSKIDTLEIPDIEVFIDDKPVQLKKQVIDLDNTKYSIIECLKKFYVSATVQRVDPKDLFTEICKKAPRFRGWNQQDSHELLRYLMDGLRTEEIDRFRKAVNSTLGISGPIKDLDPELLRKQRAMLEVGRRPTIDSVFGGNLVQTIQCQKCHFVSCRLEPFMDLSLCLASVSSSSHTDYRTMGKKKGNKGRYQDDERKEKKAKWHRDQEEEEEIVPDDTESSSTTSESSTKDDNEDNSKGDDMSEAVDTTATEEEQHWENNDFLKYTEVLADVDETRLFGRTVYNCLSQFTAKEVLTGTNAYECEKCCLKQNKKVAKKDPKAPKKKVDAVKRYLIFSPPCILTLHIKRFEQYQAMYSTSTRKISGFVDFDFDMDLAPFCAKEAKRITPGETSVLYRLYGIVVHSGGLGGGHYIAYVKTRNKVPHLEQFYKSSKCYEDFIQRATDKETSLDGIKKSYEQCADEIEDGFRWYYCSDSSVRPVDPTEVARHIMTAGCSLTPDTNNCNNNKSCGSGSFTPCALVKFSAISGGTAVILNLLNTETSILTSIFLIVVANFFFSDLFWRIIQTLPRDIRGLKTLVAVKLTIKKALVKNVPLHHYWLESVNKHPDKDAIVEVESGRKFSFLEINVLANQYANFFDSIGYKKGDVVALYSENSANYFAFWLGMSKIGVVTAWINSNLKLEPLAHSIKASNTKAIITTSTLTPTLENAFSKNLLKSTEYKIFILDDTKVENTILLADVISNKKEIETSKQPSFKDVLCYIYTSGTTGNPKPAVIKHFRFFFMSNGVRIAFGINNRDRLYITMPMYHSAAGVLGVGQTIVNGSTLVIRKKFSASNFWKDAVKYECTVSQYIGEICRYLLAQKVVPEEKTHKIRLMYGNGLREAIWSEFVERFDVRRIGEFYGSTEGNSNILNLNSHRGSVGFLPTYPGISALYPVRLLKVDEETGELIRDKNGMCIMCNPGETGEMCGVIKEGDPLLNFEGYVDKDDTSKKVIRDVSKKGDLVFTSGDILHWDKLGYLQFRDRRGDTFRWKGENVSTMEVEGILQPVMTVEDASVYGVELFGKEGKAGMAGVKLVDDVDITKFLEETAHRLIENLAPYAVPIFMRICKEVEQTGTFKLKKTSLQKEGFDVSKCHGDAVYYMDWPTKTYKLLTSDIQKEIESGTFSRF